MGTSYFFKRPTTEVILQKLPATLELVFAASLIIILVSIPLGVYTAIKPNSILSKSIMGLSIVGISVPVFLTAIVLINVFSLKFGWLPSYGRGDTSSPFGWESGLFTWDGISHLILPAVALSSIMLPLFIRLVRSEMLEALSAEYIRFAYAKGLPTETVFQWPGVGFMFLEAVNRADIPLLTTYIIFVGLIFVTTNTLIDLIYGLIDPTVNLIGGKH